jgi:hypothetical protein
LDGAKLDIFYLGIALLEMIMGQSVFKDFSSKDTLYGLYLEDLLNNNKGTKFFAALAKILINKE